MAVTVKATEDELRKQFERIGYDLDQIDACFRQIDNIIGSSRSYWEGEAGAEHRAIFEELSEDAGRVSSRFRERTDHLRDRIGLAGSSDEKEALSLPDDLL